MTQCACGHFPSSQSWSVLRTHVLRTRFSQEQTVFQIAGRFMHVSCRVGQGLSSFGVCLQFDQTCGFPCEGPSVAHAMQVGSANITSWGSLRDELSSVGSPLLKGQVWAIREHTLHSDNQRADAEDKLKHTLFKTYFLMCEQGKGEGLRAGWDGFVMSGFQVGQIIREPRAVSITLFTPMPGQLTLVLLYGWVDDHDRACGLVHRVAGYGV